MCPTLSCSYDLGQILLCVEHHPQMQVEVQPHEVENLSGDELSFLMVDLKLQVCTTPHQQLKTLIGFFFGLGISTLEQGQSIPVEEFLDHSHHLGEESRDHTDLIW